MASEHRTAIYPVEEAVAEMSEHIGSFDFVAAMRQLECASPEKPRVGEAIRIKDDVVRISQNVSMGFQGRVLHSLDKTKGAHPLRLHVNFMGLLGSHGPMPLHYTEYADQRTRHHNDPTFKEFLDLFNHRMLSLFYRASVQFDPAVMFDRPGNNVYEEFLGALSGLLPEASADRDSIPEAAKRYYPAWFSSTAKSPDGITSIVGDYFDLPVGVKQWVGGWLALPESAHAELGSGKESTQLGRAMYIGRRVWSIRHKFNIQLGPLDWDDFSSFKPGSKRAKTLYDLVRNYIGDEWDWDLELFLKDKEIRPLVLNRSRALGTDSWVVGDRGKQLKSQTVLLNRQLISRLAQ